MTTVTSGQTLTIDTTWNNSNSVTSSNVSGQGSDILNADGSFQYLSGTNNLTGLLIAQGGSVQVNSGGSVTSSVISGNETLGAGAVDTLGIVYGTQTLTSGAVSNETTIYGSQTVSSGGEAMNSWLMGTETVASGGSNYDIRVDGNNNVTNSQISSLADIFGTANYDYLTNSGSLLTVESGGVANYTTVTVGGYDTVNSGGVTNNTTLIGITASISIVANEVVSAGGFSNATLDYQGGAETVYGQANNLSVFSNGTLIMESGGVVSGGNAYAGSIISGLVISSGAINVVNGNFVTNGFTVHSGALVNGLEVASGATVTGFVNGYQFGGGPQAATLNVDSGAVVSNTLSIGSTENVSGTSVNDSLQASVAVVKNAGGLAGTGGISYTYIGASENVYGLASGVSVGNYSVLTVYSGGEADNVNVLSGGSAMLNSGGIISGGSVASGGMISGLQLTSAVSTVNGITIIDGISLHSGAMVGLEVTSTGTLTGFTDHGQYNLVDSGGVVSAITVTSSGTLDVYGTANNVMLMSGAILIAESGSTITGGSVAAGATVSGLVFSASNAEVLTGGSYNFNGTQIVNGADVSIEITSTASISGFMIESGQTATIDSGATASNDTVFNGGTEQINGTVHGDIINSGGNASVNSGGVLSGSVVNSGGTLSVQSGGMADNVMLGLGASETNNGGVLSGGSVASGATLNGLVLANGNVSAVAGIEVISGITIHSGAMVGLEISGGATLTGFFESGQTETIDSGAITNGDLIYNGGQEQVNGIANHVMVYSGGSESVNSGGMVSGVTLTSGGSATINSGGTADMLNVNSGASETIAGGTVSGGSVASGGMLAGLVLADGVVTGSNGNEMISGITIHSGALVGLEIANGAQINNFVLSNGQAELIDSGGVTSGDVVLSGATDTVNGTAHNVMLDNGGNLLVNSGGFAYGVQVENGGIETLSSGGTISGGSVFSGGDITVNSGGVVQAVQLNGGMLTYNDYADSSQSVVFVGSNGGELSLAQPSLYSGVISGFGYADIVDLQNVTVTSLTLGGGNLLTLNNSDGSSETLQFDPSQSLNVNDFYVTSDGNGGSDLRLYTGTAASLSGVSYNAVTGILTLTGSHLSTSNIATGLLTVADLTLTGDSGNTFTLTSSSAVTGTPTANSVAIQLSAADQGSLDALFNKNGSQALSGDHYTLSASSGWDTGANSISNQAVTVSQVHTPTLTGISYDTASGVFSITGNYLNSSLNLNDINLHGTSAGFLASNFTLGNFTANGFTLTADSATASNAVNALFSASTPGLSTGPDYSINNGPDQFSNTGLTYTANPVSFNINTSSGWDGPLSQASNAQALSASSDTIYNAAIGQLFLNAGVWSTKYFKNIYPTAFTFSGEGGQSYTLTNSTALTAPLNSGGNIVIIQLSNPDEQAVNALLDINGTSAVDGTGFSLAAVGGWWIAGRAQFGQPETTGVLVTGDLNQPVLNAVSYNNATGTLSFVGSTPSTTLNIGNFSLSVGGNTYQLNASTDLLTSIGANGFSLNLSTAGQAAIDSAIAAGDSLTLAATAGWSGSGGMAISNFALSVSNPTASSLLTGLNSAAGLGLDAAGNLYIANSGANAIDKLAAGAHTDTVLVASGLSHPDAVAVSGSTVYFADTGNNAIKEVSTTGGAASTLISSGLNHPDSLAVFGGNLYIADNGNNAIKEYNLSSHVLSTVVSVTNPTSMTFDTAGDLYIGTGTGLKELLHGSSTLTTLLSSGLGSTNGIAVDSNGNVYIADSVHHAIEEYTANTHTLSTINNAGVGTPTGISIDSNGNLYVTDSANNSVEELMHYNTVLNTPLLKLENNDAPPTINNLWENTNQIELSKAVFTAFAGQTTIAANEFSNVSNVSGNGATSATDYLYYNSTNGGLYYDAGGSHGGTYLEIAVVGVNEHPAALTLGDFKLIA